MRVVSVRDVQRVRERDVEDEAVRDEGETAATPTRGRRIRRVREDTDPER